MRDLKYIPRKDPTKLVFNLEDIVEANFIHTSSVMFRNELKWPFWLFSRLSTLSMFDWFLFILNAELGKIGYIRETMSAYRIHAAGKWSSMNQEDRIKMTIRVLELLNVYLNYRYADKLNKTISKFWLNLFLEEAEDPLFALLTAYWARNDLQKAFPEVREGRYDNLLNWAGHMFANRREKIYDGNYSQLSQFSHWFENDGRSLAEMDRIIDSFGYKFMQFYSSRIDKLFPDGTRRGKFRKIVTGSIVAVINQGIRSYFRQVIDRTKRRQIQDSPTP
jgi:hypothetical protein